MGFHNPKGKESYKYILEGYTVVWTFYTIVLQVVNNEDIQHESKLLNMQ